MKKQQKYYVTGSLKNDESAKIIIKTKDINEALQVEHELYNLHTAEIYNVRRSKQKPRFDKELIKHQINSISDIY